MRNWYSWRICSCRRGALGLGGEFPHARRAARRSASDFASRQTPRESIFHLLRLWLPPQAQASSSSLNTILIGREGDPRPVPKLLLLRFRPLTNHRNDPVKWKFITNGSERLPVQHAAYRNRPAELVYSRRKLGLSKSRSREVGLLIGYPEPSSDGEGRRAIAARSRCVPLWLRSQLEADRRRDARIGVWSAAANDQEEPR